MSNTNKPLGKSVKDAANDAGTAIRNASKDVKTSEK